jgi:hypothetical protein
MSGIIIYARSMTNTITIELECNACVWDLKKAIPGEYKIISYQGFKLIDNDAALADLGICPESTIDVNYERIPYDTFREKYDYIVLNINLDDQWIDCIEDTVEIYPPSPHSNGTNLVDKYNKHIPGNYEYEIVAMYSHVFAPDGEALIKNPDINGIVIRNRNSDHQVTFGEHNIIIEICESLMNFECCETTLDSNENKVLIFSAPIYDYN